MTCTRKVCFTHYSVFVFDNSGKDNSVQNKILPSVSIRSLRSLTHLNFGKLIRTQIWLISYGIRRWISASLFFCSLVIFELKKHLFWVVWFLLCVTSERNYSASKNVWKSFSVHFDLVYFVRLILRECRSEIRTNAIWIIENWK